VKTKSITELPEAWLCVHKHAFLPGMLDVEECFDTYEAAVAYKGKQRHIRVEKDTPDLRVYCDGITITKPHNLTMRENWLVRNQSFIEPCLTNAKVGVVFTWEAGTSPDLLASRLGGDAPLQHDEAWPVCEQCSQLLLFVGVLDFRDTDYRTSVPRDAMSYFQCYNIDSCDYFMNAAIKWLNAVDNLVTKAHPTGQQAGSFVGTPWLIVDYSMNDLDYFDKEEEELEAQYDMKLVGGSPYFSVGADGVKIGGHPFWIQGDESADYTCSCDQPMAFLAQLTEPEEYESDGMVYIVHCATNTCEDYGVIIQSF